MSVLFIDTDSELPYSKCKEAGITNIIKMPYSISGEQYYDDLGQSDYVAKDFFNKIREGNMPTTSGLNAEEYKEYFEPYFAKNEDILYVSFSTEMSSTFNYLDIAIKELTQKYPKAKFRRFDTRCISLLTGLPCYFAGKMHSQGKSNDEIIGFLEEMCPKMKTMFSPDDLHHLKRGGRLSGVRAALGTLLQVKPIIKMKDGKLYSASKVNGRKKALNYIADETIANVRETDKYPIIIMDADCKEEAKFISERISAALPDAEIWSVDVGPVTGSHCGPGTIATVFVGEPE